MKSIGIHDDTAWDGISEKRKITTVMVIPATKTTTEGPIVLKSTPTPKELLSGQLFQVAGIFAIGEPGWADKHDGYLAET